MSSNAKYSCNSAAWNHSQTLHWDWIAQANTKEYVHKSHLDIPHVYPLITLNILYEPLGGCTSMTDTGYMMLHVHNHTWQLLVRNMMTNHGPPTSCGDSPKMVKLCPRLHLQHWTWSQYIQITSSNTKWHQVCHHIYPYHIHIIFNRTSSKELRLLQLLHRHDLRGSCTKLVRGHQKQRGRAGVAKDRDLSCWSLVDPGLRPKDPGRTQFAGGNHGEIGGRSISLNLLESSKMAAKLPMLCDDVPIWMFIY